jgi:hypothetical protein
VQFGYGQNYLVDTDNVVIFDVEATPARTYDEVAATKTMVDRTERCFARKPKRLAPDTAYGTGKFLGWLVNDKRITPHISVWEKREQMASSHARTSSGTSGMATTSVPTARSSAPAADCDGRTLLYRASKRDCDVCPLKPRCCTECGAQDPS